MHYKGLGMFLYYEDYAHLPIEHYHMSTKNHSFTRMSVMLKKMGINNNKFFLLLTQPELAKHDPHNLTDESIELKLKIIYEAKVNPWYALREIIRIPETGGFTPFLLSRANLAINWMYFNCIDTLTVMPRQHGKTIGTMCTTAIMLYLAGINFQFTMVAQGDRLRKENVERLKGIRDEFPPWMLKLDKMNDINNMESVSYEALKNSYKTFVGNSSPALADKAARGITTPSIHWDEIAHLINNHVMYPIAIGTTRAAINSAKKHGELYGNVLTTTVGDLNQPEGVYCHDMINTSLPFTEHLYDVKDNPTLKKLVAANSKEEMVYAEFNHLQLGTSDEELEKLIARSKAPKDVTDMEYRNIWRVKGAGTLFAEEDIARLKASVIEPKYIQYVDEFIIRWYLPKDLVLNKERLNTIPLLVGTDSSENIGSDFTTLVFVDARSMVVVATCRVNTVNTIKVGVFVAKLIKDLNMLWIPERNSTGVSIIDAALIELEKFNINPFEVIYNNIVQDNDKHSNVNIHTLGIVNKYREHFGRRTTAGAKGRTFLYKTVFFKGMEEVSDFLNDSTLINEIIGLKEEKGRIDHEAGSHDDMVISWILTLFVAYFGKHLHMYKIFKRNPGLLLSKIEKVKNVVQVRNDKISEEITELMLQKKKCRSEALKRTFDIKIKRLSSKLSVEDQNKLPDAQALAKIEKQRAAQKPVKLESGLIQQQVAFI